MACLPGFPLTRRISAKEFCRTRLLRNLIGILGPVFLSASLLAQQTKVLAPHKPFGPKAPYTGKWKKAAMPRSMVGGLWMIDANFKSSIYIKNSVEVSAVTVTPVLYLSNGKRYALADVTLEPAGTAVVNVNEALAQKGIAPWARLTGYVEIDYTWPWDPVCVTVTSVDPVYSVIFTSGLKASSTDILGPPLHQAAQIGPGTYSVEGMWWKQEVNVTGFIALSNISEQPVAAKVQVTDNSGNLLGEHSVRISPHGTKMVDIPELLATSGSAGGVRVTYAAPQDSVLVNGGLEDAASGYSAMVPFGWSPDASAKVAPAEVAELGLMVGAADPMMSFPDKTAFTPYSVLRNLSDQPVPVTPSVWWMQGGVPHSASGAPFIIQPSQTQSLDLIALLSKAGLANFNGSINLVLDFQSQPGGLLLAGGSVDQKNTYVFPAVPRGVHDSEAKAISYWSIANGDDTMVTVWNPADEAQDFMFTLHFAGGQYRLPIHLGPRATQMLTLSEVVQNQIPDAEGNIIPPTVKDGSATLAGAQADNQEILVAMDAGTYNVRKATCTYYCISCNGTVSVNIVTNPFALAKGGQTTLIMMGNQNTGGSYQLYGPSWSSNNTSVVSVGSSSGVVSGVAFGTAMITASLQSTPVYNPNWCSYNYLYCPDYGPASGSDTGTVAPTISQDQALWYFDGNPVPSGFTLGSTTVTLTASGGGSGTYGWSIKSGSSIAALKGTTSGTNVTSVQISSTGYSTAENDVTVQLQFEPSSGTQSVQTSYSLTVDSPYKFVSTGSTTNKGVAGPCSQIPSPSGTAGFQSLVPYAIISFQGQQITHIPVFESLNNDVPFYTGETWPFAANGFTSTDGTLVDNICAVGSLTPHPLPPQSPTLSTTAIDQINQQWTVGGGSVASGLPVQTDTLQRFIDHGRHTGITSPVR
jgi:hypothetical protein